MMMVKEWHTVEQPVHCLQYKFIIVFYLLSKNVIIKRYWPYQSVIQYSDSWSTKTKQVI